MCRENSQMMIRHMVSVKTLSFESVYKEVLSNGLQLIELSLSLGLFIRMEGFFMEHFGSVWALNCLYAPNNLLQPMMSHHYNVNQKRCDEEKNAFEFENQDCK